MEHNHIREAGESIGRGWTLSWRSRWRDSSFQTDFKSVFSRNWSFSSAETRVLSQTEKLQKFTNFNWLRLKMFLICSVWSWFPILKSSVQQWTFQSLIWVIDRQLWSTSEQKVAGLVPPLWTTSPNVCFSFAWILESFNPWVSGSPACVWLEST